MNTAVHFSSATCEWATPQWLFDALAREFAFTLDPCAERGNAKCPRFFTREDEGLARDWADEIVFMNPPYGGVIGQWMRKAYESSRRGATVVCLVPARTDTAWWHDYAMKGEVRLLRGRLKFGNARNSAPFPSAVVIFRPPQFQVTDFTAEAQRGREGDEPRRHQGHQGEAIPNHGCTPMDTDSTVGKTGTVKGKQVGREKASFRTLTSTITLPLSAHRKLRPNGESASPCP